MCGIFGCYSRVIPADVETRLVRANDALRHRGPDSSDIWCEKEKGIALSHTRLSILELSSAGNQPMHSSDNRFVITYNGEIYNHLALREEIRRYRPELSFSGNSDTSTLLEACALWGVRKAIEKMVGMFAFALWDKKEQTLYLVRDRLGIKPLYWSYDNKSLEFGSELKAFSKFRNAMPEIDNDALFAFMSLGYVPSPLTIFRGIQKLPPAGILTVKTGREPVLDSYWQIEDVILKGLAERESTDAAALQIEFESLLRDAVQQRLISDVPVGAFLSGGIDSSAVVALMQECSAQQVKTYSIGFHERSYNEAQQAALVARHLGTSHTECYVSNNEALAVIPDLPSIYDEPFADSSQIPTYLVAKMTKESVSVALSGDGGDEIFAGYNRYLLTQGNLERLRNSPGFIKMAFRGIVKSTSQDNWDRIFAVLPGGMRIPQAGDKLYKLAEVMDLSPEQAYRKLTALWPEPNHVLSRPGRYESTYLGSGLLSELELGMDKMQYLDIVTYLPDDILTKVDRATMAVSLEARIPLLDHRLIELAWKAPHSMKVTRGQGKQMLRKLVYQYVPEDLLNKPKTGFSLPLDNWLRNGLRGWVEDVLTEEKLREQGFLDVNTVRNIWRQHLSGSHNHTRRLWSVLMFQSWYDCWVA